MSPEWAERLFTVRQVNYPGCCATNKEFALHFMVIVQSICLLVVFSGSAETKPSERDVECKGLLAVVSTLSDQSSFHRVFYYLGAVYMEGGRS